MYEADVASEIKNILNLDGSFSAEESNISDEQLIITDTGNGKQYRVTIEEI